MISGKVAIALGSVCPPQDKLTFVGVLLLIFVSLLAKVSPINLFEATPYRQGPEKEKGAFVPCETSILQEFENMTGTGTKVYNTQEKQIQFCPNICDHPDVKNDYCEEHEKDYIEAFSADIHSDRCCDERFCKCICHFTCKTFATKKAEYEASGYRDCAWGKVKEETLNQSKENCKEHAKTLDCSRQHKLFLCPKQFACVGEKCLACISPTCITASDKLMTRDVIKAYNASETKDIDKVRLRALQERKQMEEITQKAGKIKAHRGFRTLINNQKPYKPKEVNIQAGIEM